MLIKCEESPHTFVPLELVKSTKVLRIQYVTGSDKKPNQNQNHVSVKALGEGVEVIINQIKLADQ